MATPGLVAIDPLRLAELEGTVVAVGDTCRRVALQAGDALVGTGESAGDALAALHGVARWAEHQCTDLARRRSVVEALPTALALPAWRFRTAAAAEAAGARVGDRLVALLARRPVPWEGLEACLAEVARGAHHGAFAVEVLHRIGPRAAARLGLVVEAAALSHPSAPAPGRQLQVVERLLRTAMGRDEGGLTTVWLRRFAGLPDVPPPDDAEHPDPEPVPEAMAALEAAGFGARVVQTLAIGAGAGRLGMVFGGADTLVGFVVPDPDLPPVVDAVATGMDMAGKGALWVGRGMVVTNPVGAVVSFGVGLGLLAGAGLLRLFSWGALDGALPENRRRRHTPSYDTDTGTTHYPGGGTDRPHQDGAGGVLPPNHVR